MIELIIEFHTLQEMDGDSYLVYNYPYFVDCSLNMLRVAEFCKTKHIQLYKIYFEMNTTIQF